MSVLPPIVSDLDVCFARDVYGIDEPREDMCPHEWRTVLAGDFPQPHPEHIICRHCGGRQP